MSIPDHEKKAQLSRPFGCVTPLPLYGFPPGRVRIRIRQDDCVRVIIRTPGGLEQWIPREVDGKWVPDILEAANHRPARSEDGSQQIARERARQIGECGWTAGHDDDHRSGELTAAALTYAEVALRQLNEPDSLCAPGAWWPWFRRFWKPSASPIRNLAKAGALIAAEIDRLLRAEFETLWDQLAGGRRTLELGELLEAMRAADIPEGNWDGICERIEELPFITCDEDSNFIDLRPRG